MIAAQQDIQDERRTETSEATASCMAGVTEDSLRSGDFHGQSDRGMDSARVRKSRAIQAGVCSVDEIFNLGIDLRRRLLINRCPESIRGRRQYYSRRNCDASRTSAATEDARHLRRVQHLRCRREYVASRASSQSRTCSEVDPGSGSRKDRFWRLNSETPRQVRAPRGWNVRETLEDPRFAINRIVVTDDSIAQSDLPWQGVCTYYEEICDANT